MKFQNGEEFVKNLVSQYCPDPTVSSTIRLETYYKKAHSMFHHALDFVKQGNDARSYIELMRYCQLISTLTTHNGYNLKQYEKDKNLNKRRLEKAITKLEILKPKLIKTYNDEIEKEKEKPLLKKIEEEVGTDEQTNEEKKEQIKEEKEEIIIKKDNNINRWNNLKLEASPQFNKQNINKNNNKNNNKLDAIFQKPPPSLTPIYMTHNLIADFIKYCETNTKRDIETCAVLTGKYLHDQDAYIITYVIIPKQKGSANTVQTLCEEELIGVQEKYGVITLGWIHTHPSQTCFLSSVDMHCQLSYQIMMPNAIAIVYAPTDKTETFTLTKKGIDILSKCSCQGFHRHEGVHGLYHQANHVHVAKRQKCKFIDLRK